MPVTVREDSRGRLILEDSGGDLWYVYAAPGDRRRAFVTPLDVAPDAECLIFAGEREDRAFSSLPVAWQHLAAQELDACCRAAVRLSGLGRTHQRPP